MQYFTIAILCLLFSTPLSSQNTVLNGKALDYRKKEIVFYTIPDPVLHQKIELATAIVADDGTFSVSLPLRQTIAIYSDLEKYCGTMVAEPGKNYTITLPPYSLRTADEAHSSYFKPAPYWFGLPVTSSDDLNNTVRSFVTDLNSEIVKNTIPIYQKKSKEVVNGIIARLEKKYSTNGNNYFKTLKMYSYAELEYTVCQNTPEFIIKKYFATQPVQLIHPVYQRVFETLFTDFLRKQSLDIQNRKIVSITNSGNYLGLVSFLENKGYQKEFAELVVLKGLNDGFYSGSFSKSGVTAAIIMAQTATTSQSLLTIAHRIKSKLTLLTVGGKAPEIKLYNQKKEIITLDHFNGKFVYLLFFNSRSSDCKAQLDSIFSMEKKLRQVLHIVSVATDDDFENAVKLWKVRGYSWELLNGSKQKQLITNYNASITPVFYLIDPNGMIQLAQAPSPSQGFESLFIKIFRDFRFKQQRN